MVTTCVAVGCHNRQDKTQEKSFYRFPSDPKRRALWISAINRKHWEPTSSSRVCSDHFIKKKCDDPLSPDYVPTQFTYIQTPEKRKAEESLDKFHRRSSTKEKRKLAVSIDNAASGLLALSTQEPPVPPPEEVSIVEDIIDQPEDSGISIQTDITMQDMDALRSECQGLRSEVMALREKLQNVSLDQKSLEKDDKRVTILTGLPSFASLMCLYNLLSSSLKPMESLSVFQQIFITLLRLRFNLNMQYLGFMYGVHSSTISRLFQLVIDVMHAKLVPATVFWPERELLRKTLPACFKTTFPKCACIIDCFELFIEKPSDLKARAQTYSNYKSHNTAKYLIGISPQGLITFISKGYGGRVSDKFITEDCGILDKIIPGDTILADRGFDLKDTFGLYGAKLEIPSFTKGKKQLDALDIESTRLIASVRIHVERVIGVVRQKYTILESITPITSVNNVDGNNFTTLDKIVHNSCGLVNLCPSVIPVD